MGMLQMMSGAGGPRPAAAVNTTVGECDGVQQCCYGGRASRDGQWLQRNIPAAYPHVHFLDSCVTKQGVGAKVARDYKDWRTIPVVGGESFVVNEEADNDSVGDAGCQTACARQHVIITGAFVDDDSQKELDFPDGSLMSPTAQTQTLREDGGSSRAPTSLDTVSRPRRGSRFGQWDTPEEGSQASSRSRGKQNAHP
mmetsp:Transcript_84084/g.136294  ORF Transcript_84084/g.136294 Transcript_84084/m.136294 type:complete len:197 (-) Transcript_84084:463-1053(-)